MKFYDGIFTKFSIFKRDNLRKIWFYDDWSILLLKSKRLIEFRHCIRPIIWSFFRIWNCCLYQLSLTKVYFIG